MRTVTGRTIGGAVSSTGVIIRGAGPVSARKTATGIYELAAAPGLRFLSVGVGPTTLAGADAQLATVTDTTVGVQTYNQAGAAADGGFWFRAEVTP